MVGQIMQLGICTENLDTSVTLWPLQSVKAYYTSQPDTFAFGDADPDCDTELTVIDNDGFQSTYNLDGSGNPTSSVLKSGSFVAGGFTQSKKMASGQYAAEALKKHPNLKKPEWKHCYDTEAYFCDHPLTSDPVTNPQLRGRAFIFAGIDSVNENNPRTSQDENIKW